MLATVPAGPAFDEIPPVPAKRLAAAARGSGIRSKYEKFLPPGENAVRRCVVRRMCNLSRKERRRQVGLLAKLKRAQRKVKKVQRSLFKSFARQDQYGFHVSDALKLQEMSLRKHILSCPVDSSSCLCGHCLLRDVTGASEFEQPTPEMRQLVKDADCRNESAAEALATSSESEDARDSSEQEQDVSEDDAMSDVNSAVCDAIVL